MPKRIEIRRRDNNKLVVEVENADYTINNTNDYIDFHISPTKDEKIKKYPNSTHKLIINGVEKKK